MYGVESLLTASLYQSTILRLLYRFYDAGKGEITVGGQDVHGMQRESLQRAIAVVPQDIVLFNESILYNINYGNLKANTTQVIDAAKQARIHDTITSLPKGYETVVGERGLKLSGGEKQRVSFSLLARSVYFLDIPKMQLLT